MLLPSATKLRRLCFYTCLSVILFGGGAIQHALQVVSHPSMPCSRGCVCYPSMHCRLYPSMPWSEGVCPGGGACFGGACSRGVPAPGGCLLPGMCGDPPPESGRLLLRTVRILLECILVVFCSRIIGITALPEHIWQPWLTQGSARRGDGGGRIVTIWKRLHIDEVYRKLSYGFRTQHEYFIDGYFSDRVIQFKDF